MTKFWEIWKNIRKSDIRARDLADSHYSRQSRGSALFVPPGKVVMFLHENSGRYAVWSVVYNRDPSGEFQWRNTLFRNETSTLSSLLIETATLATYEIWKVKYGSVPTKPLTTEVDVAKTSRRRGRRNLPGHCYRMAGWQEVRRWRGMVVLKAPRQ